MRVLSAMAARSADRALNVYTYVFWASVVLGVIVTGLLLYAFVKFRRRSDDDDPAQFHGNTRLEIAWTLVPLATFLSLFGLTAANMPFINNIASDSAVHRDGDRSAVQLDVRLRRDHERDAHPELRHALPAREHRRRTQRRVDGSAVQLNPSIPANSTEAQAISNEGCGVNHSFFAPSLGQQMNAIPGDVNTAPIEARQGTYYGQCTELCGVGHATMTFVVIALPANQFQSCVFGNPSGTIDPTSKACTLGGS